MCEKIFHFIFDYTQMTIIICILVYNLQKRGETKRNLIFRSRITRRGCRWSFWGCARSKDAAQRRKYLFLQENKYFFNFPLANLRIVCYNVIKYQKVSIGSYVCSVDVYIRRAIMAGLEPKKLALLRIWQILLKHSDYEHPLTQEEIIKHLENEKSICYNCYRKW